LALAEDDTELKTIASPLDFVGINVPALVAELEAMGDDPEKFNAFPSRVA
jgi:hypothetical protein